MKNKSVLMKGVDQQSKMNLQNESGVEYPSNKPKGSEILNSKRFVQFKEHFDDLKNILKTFTHHQSKQQQGPLVISSEKNIQRTKAMDDDSKKKNRNQMVIQAKKGRNNDEQQDLWSPQLQILQRKDFRSFKSERIVIESDVSVKKVELKLIKQNKANRGPSTIKKGIKNIGNTCYINSIVQCLFHLPHFNSYFQEQTYARQKNGRDKNVVQIYIKLYVDIMKNKSQQDVSTFLLKKSVSNICSLFMDWEQEDAHEFMSELLMSLHEELNRVVQKPKYTRLDLLTEKQNLEDKALLSWQYELSRDNSYIYESFCGQIYNNIRCSLCHNESQCFQNFLDISLPIISNSNSLQSLLKSFFSEERLNDYYKCQHCNKSSKFAIKKMQLWKLPKFLIIHLKRSQFGHKNISPIKVPEVLKLKQYMTLSNDKTAKFCQYNLCGMIMHRGVIQGGHYWCNVKQNGKWYQIDDDEVKQMPNDKFRQENGQNGSINAYILFYASFYC